MRVKFRRQVEHVAELAVPADQAQILVEHRDALPREIERGLQHFAVVVDRGGGVVEQLERRLGGDVALAQQQRQHEPRRRGADGRRQQIFGDAQQVDSRPRPADRSSGRARRKSLEGLACALLAEIARDGALRLPRRETDVRHSRKPGPSARKVLADEECRPAGARSGVGRRTSEKPHRPRHSGKQARARCGEGPHRRQRDEIPRRGAQAGVERGEQA